MSLLGGGFSFWAVPPALLLGALGLLAAVPAQAQHVAPSDPQNVQWTPGNKKVTLTWEEPSSWGSGTRGGFQLQHNLNGAFRDVTNNFSDTDRTLTSYQTGLLTNIEPTNGSPFKLRIRAYTVKSGVADPDNPGLNDFLDSSWVTVTVTPGLPAKIADSALTVTPGNAKLDLSWTAPSGNGSAISGYDVHYTSAVVGTVANDAAVQTGLASAGWKAVSRSGTTASQSITSLTNDTAYRVRVRAKNTNGNGAWVFAPAPRRRSPRRRG